MAGVLTLAGMAATVGMTALSAMVFAPAAVDVESGKSPKAANWVAAEEAAGVVDGKAGVAVAVDEAGAPATAAFKACIKGSAALTDAVPEAVCERGKPLAAKATPFVAAKAAFSAGVAEPSPNSF